MTAIAIIGFFVFLFSLAYAIFHFIRRIKDRNKVFSKKLFLPSFIGGFLMLIIGGSYIDTGLQDQLTEALQANEMLSSENKELKAEMKVLQVSVEDLTAAKEDLDKELNEVSTKVEAAEKAEQQLNEQKDAFDTEKADLTKQITDLQEKNKSLDSEVSSLKGQLASRNTSTSTASNNSSASTSSQSTSTAAATVINESFANCTELRKVYPNGVSSDHSAYQSKMDRDKYNLSC